MNPSIFYPELLDRPWYHAPLPPDQRTLFICTCGLPDKEGAVENMSDRGVLLNYLRWSAANDPKIVAIVGVGQCPRCGAVHWCTDNYYNLIKLCESKGMEEV